MENNIAISFENVSKLYRLGLVGTGTLSQDIHRWWVRDVLKKGDPYLKIGQTNDRSTKGTSDFVYALKNIDFKQENPPCLNFLVVLPLQPKVASVPVDVLLHF